jgi:hypothetical protein
LALKIFPGEAKGSERSLSWYLQWLELQAALLPDELYQTLFTSQSLPNGPWMQKGSLLLDIFLSIAEFVTKRNFITLDSAVQHLQDAGHFQAHDGMQQYYQRNLVFAVLGWQTMLWTASPQTNRYPKIGIADELNGYKGEAIFAFQQDHKAAKLPFYEFLMGYGQLIPAQATENKDVEAGKMHDIPASILPEELNCFTLSVLGGVTIRWVDTMSSHLEFDQAGRHLFLFRYPSFCQACLSTQSPGTLDLNPIIMA